MGDPQPAVPLPATRDKPALRRAMRGRRLGLADRSARSAALWVHVRALPDVVTARRVMAFTAVAGEPETMDFVAWCRAAGKDVAVPEDGPEPSWPDVVIVPGLAFTLRGDRLGQGGGWYDRFLVDTRPDCTTIGVCFDVQVAADLPVEDHDIPVDRVVTESGLVTPS